MARVGFCNNYIKIPFIEKDVPKSLFKKGLIYQKKSHKGLVEQVFR